MSSLKTSLPTNSSKHTSNMTSYTQLEKLLDILETKVWLANGHARTEHARNRARNAWEEIASIINCEGRGRVRSGPQWAKYWKDKKGSVKKKIKALNAAQIQTGGNVNEDMQLNELEERLVTLIGLSKGDNDLEVDPLHENELNDDTELIQSESEKKLSGHHDNYITSPQSILKMVSDVANAEDEPTRSECSSPQPEPIKAEQEDTFQTIDPEPDYEPHRPPVHRRVVYTPPKRLRRLNNRHAILRPLPSKRRSEMETMSERILAIEERRVETEHLQAKTQQMLAKSALLQSRTQQMLATSLVNHNRTIHDIGNNFISILEKYLSGRRH